MKLFLLLLLLCINIFATEKLVTTKLAQGQSCYGTGIFECTFVTDSTSISQMFQNNVMNGNAQAISCKN